jgi:hypothetical protein
MRLLELWDHRRHPGDHPAHGDEAVNVRRVEVAHGDGGEQVEHAHLHAGAVAGGGGGGGWGGGSGRGSGSGSGSGSDGQQWQ